MKYRYLRSTDLKISEIGFGAWGIGGNNKNSLAYGPTNDNVSHDALKEAYDCGINFFDTSPLYGFGHSEKLIGKTFKGCRDKIIILTKVGYTDYLGNSNFSTKYIIDSLEKSMKRLKTDYIDIYQLHDPSLKLIKNSSEILDLMYTLKKEGKIRYFGISTRTQEESLNIIDENCFNCMQINFNLIDQRAIENNLFKKCKQNNIGIIGKTPLSFGFLTGNILLNNNFHKNDHRNRFSSKQLRIWSTAIKKFLKEYRNDTKNTNAQISLRFCLSFSEISSVLPGMLTKEQVKENIISSHLGSFPDEIINQFKKIYKDNTFYL